MSHRQILVSLVVSIMLFVTILGLVRKGKLEIAYSLLWLFLGFAILGVVIKYEWLEYLTRLIGAVVPTTTLFMLAIIIILLLCLQLSIAMSRQSRDIRRLTQELAILKVEARLPRAIIGNGSICTYTELDSGDPGSQRA